MLIRPRHTVSVHRLRLKRGQLGDCDFARLLVLVDEDADCYAVLGELHTCFAPLVSEFKDFIAAPKFNLYQSLHTAIADENGEVAEVLVRTRRMHRVAETGVIALGDPHAAEVADPAEPDGGGAAPPNADGAGERTDPTRPGWLSRLLEWQSHASDPNTFWRELRDELAQDLEITVYCAAPGGAGPAGGALPLPAGATCVDAAYARLGEAAHRCIGARVNGRLVALTTVLRDGDALQLFLEPGHGSPSGPSPEWLEHVRTPAARLAIREWLAAPGRGDADPQESAAATDRDGAPREHAPAAAEPPRGEPRPPHRGARHPPSTVRRGTQRRTHGRTERTARPRTGSSRSSTARTSPSSPATPVRRCGSPAAVPRSPRTRSPDSRCARGAVTVHRESCRSVARMASAGRLTLPVRWEQGDVGCRVTLRAEAFGRPHLLADLTEAIAAEGAAVVSADVEPPREQRVRHTYTLQLPDAAGLPALLRAMRQVPGVYDVTRSVRRTAAN